MFELKSLPTQHVTPSKEPLYLSKETATDEKKIIITKGTASSVAHKWMPQEKTTIGYQSFHYPIHSNQAGVQARSEEYSGINPIIFGDIFSYQYHELTASAGLLTMKSRPIQSDETDEIEVVLLREMPYEYAKLEITRYIQCAGGRKVYISELAKELRLDIELIMEILEELETEQ